jgi:hypothetical protein
VPPKETLPKEAGDWFWLLRWILADDPYLEVYWCHRIGPVQTGLRWSTS